MGVGSGRHAELAGELVEWWEDLWQRGTTSRVVLVAVPPGWGRTTVLDRLAKAAGADDAPVTLIARINGQELPEGAGVQAAVMRDCLAEAAMRHRAAELLGLDRLGGITQLSVGVGALFVSGLAAAVGFLVAGVAVGAVGKAWDDSAAGQDGALARTARAVAEASVQVPAVVIIDDADCLDENLAVTLIENLAARHDGHVLVVAAVSPGGSLQRALVSRARQGIIEGLVHVADADPAMGYGPRTELVRELCPHLPDAAVRRIGRATATFVDVFAVASAPRLAEITAGEDEARLQEVVDAVAGVRLRRPDPSPEAVVIAWAGGLLHARQAARALGVLGLPRVAAGDPDVLRTGNLERVTDPASPRLAGQVASLAIRDRRAMAAVLHDEALRITADLGRGLVERMAAGQAAHQVRADLADRSALPGVQRELATALEALGEPAAALDVAAAALDDWPPGSSASDRDWLAAAVLRLSALSPAPAQPLVVRQLIAEAAAGGAGLGLEARIWAAIELLGTNGQRAAALELADQAAAALDEHAAALGPAADQWRLLLAFHASRAGHPALTGRLLATLLNSGDDQREDAARAVLYACAGPGADTRLQNIVLEAELAALPPDAGDDRLRIHHALAANHYALGEYRQALTHGQHELTLRTTIQSPDHPDTLTTRGNIAARTGECGDPAGALRLSRELLPDLERVLGPGHPITLTNRGNIADWTGRCGDPAGALRLSRELLPDLERVLGPGHPSTLTTRNNIAALTGECGDPAGALRLFRELLPDLERVLGPGQPITLNTRNNIAYLTGECGDPAGALRLFRELLPDLERVLGPGHPSTLTTRGNIAARTGECGDPAGALRLFRELLPDRERVLGPGHPDTLIIRDNIAARTGECGDPAGALRLSRELLPDRERVLGPDHPDTLTTRGNIAYLTGECGDPAGALRLFRELLPDRERVLGPGHPSTLNTRNNIAYLTRLLTEKGGQ